MTVRHLFENTLSSVENNSVSYLKITNVSQITELWKEMADQGTREKNMNDVYIGTNDYYFNSQSVEISVWYFLTAHH